MNRDFVEMLSLLCGAGVEFLVVGAHALAAQGVARDPKDLADIALLEGVARRSTAGRRTRPRRK